MALDVKNKILRRGGSNDALAGLEQFAEGDVTKNTLVAQGGAPYTEMARAGGVWNVLSAASAPLVAVPTTVTHLEVYNNPTSGMTMEILELFVFHLLGTAVLHNIGVWAMVTAPKAAPSTASLVISSQSGRGKYTDTAVTRVVTGAGTTIIANGWRPFGPPWGVISTALPGEAWSIPVNGQLLVPPGCSLCVHTTDALATASSVQVGAAWNERVGMVAAAA